MEKKLIERELNLEELRLTLRSMLLFDEDQGYWTYYETDLNWWRLRLYMRIN